MSAGGPSAAPRAGAAGDAAAPAGPALAIDVRDETIVTLLRRPDMRRPRATWAWLLALTVVAWVGAVAFIGRYRRHEVVALLDAVAAPETLYAGAVAAALALFVAARLARRRDAAGAALVVAALLLGHEAYAWLYVRLSLSFEVPFASFAEALAFAGTRLAYGAALVATMLVAWPLAFGTGGWPPPQLGLGDPRALGRDVSTKAPPLPWWRQLVGGYALFCLVLALVMQANVAFAPVRAGTLWPLMPGVLVAALANALAEESVFRGLVLPAFVRAGGVAAGLWMQGLLFGLMHWGLSVGVLAALPVSLLIGLGSVVWGKAALDTRGLAWVVLAHAMVDVAIMAAFFVPRA